MNGYWLDESEIKALEDDPSLLAERLKVWRAAVDRGNARDRHFREFSQQQADIAGQVDRDNVR